MCPKMVMAQRYVYIIARRALAGPHSRYPYFLYRFTASRRCAKAQAPSRPRDWQRLIPALVYRGDRLLPARVLYCQNRFRLASSSTRPLQNSKIHLEWHLSENGEETC